MKKAWNTINDNRYFIFFFVAFICVIKLLFQNTAINPAALSLAKKILLGIYAVSVIYIVITLLAILLERVVHRKQLEEQGMEKKQSVLSRVTDLFINSAVLPFGIAYYGLFIIISLKLSWLNCIAFYTISLVIKTYKIFADLYKHCFKKEA